MSGIKQAGSAQLLLAQDVVPTDVLATLELGVLLAWEHTERVGTEVVTLQSE